MSELPPEIPRARPAKPRASASGVVVSHRDGRWQVLLGLRSRKTRFMPGHLALPGGTLDPVDRPGEPGDFARCVSREVDEETGLAIAAADWLDVGERITPPMFPVRFKNRFFLAVLPVGWEPPAAPPSIDEIERVELANPAEVLGAWAGGGVKLPPPVLPILRVLAASAELSPAELGRRIAASNGEEESEPRIEFLPDVWMLPVATATLPPATHTNVWMPGGSRFAIVDPATTEPEELARLKRVIDRRRAAGSTPEMVLVTHEHADHTAGVVRVACELGLPVRAHRRVLERLQADAQSTATVERVELRDGDRIDLDGMKLRVHHTPGHAAGHLAFEIEGRHAVIAGDLVSGISTILIDPEGGDMEAYLASLERVAARDPKLLLPGHGPPVPGRALSRLIEHRAERERRIAAALAAEARGLSDVAQQAYAEVPEMPLALIRRQTLAHLIHMERHGRARRLDAAGESWVAGPAEGDAS